MEEAEPPTLAPNGPRAEKGPSAAEQVRALVEELNATEKPARGRGGEKGGPEASEGARLLAERRARFKGRKKGRAADDTMARLARFQTKLRAAGSGGASWMAHSVQFQRRPQDYDEAAVEFEVVDPLELGSDGRPRGEQPPRP